MMTNLFKILLLCLGSQAASMAEIKTLVTEKKVDEAVKILKDHHKTLLRSENERRDLSRWLSIFLYDDTMVTYEKALGLADAGKNSEAEEEFKKALVTEPYNKKVISNYVSFLISSGQLKTATALLEVKLAEQPYMRLYELYSLHIQALSSGTVLPPGCDARDLEEMEMRYCYLLQLIVKVTSRENAAKDTPESKAMDEGALKSHLKKIKAPDGHYWAWRARGDQQELKKYVSSCQSLSAEDKKSYRIIPGVCGKLEEANQKLKTVATCTSCTENGYFSFH